MSVKSRSGFVELLSMLKERMLSNCSRRIRHRISYKTAMSRLNLLTLIVSRDSGFDTLYPRKKARAKAIMEEYRERLRRLRYHRGR